MKKLIRPRLSLLALLALLTAGAVGPLALAAPQGPQRFVKAFVIQAPPVGAILAWHTHLPGTPSLPDGWMPCDGQLVSDPDSPYYGELLPDLNGDGRYLRGGMMSGILQDDTTAANGLAASIANAGSHAHTVNSSGAHTHSRTNVGGIGSARGFAAAGDQSGTTSTSTAGSHSHTMGVSGDHAHTVSLSGDAETRPITMTIVWIMRVK